MANDVKRLVVGVVCDPIDTLSFAKDTSIALMHAMLKRGWRVELIESDRLVIREKKLHGQTRSVTMDNHAAAPTDRSGVRLGSMTEKLLDTFDLILMRVDPPVDDRYLKLTWMLDFAKVPVLNPPECLRNLNEKLSALHFAYAAETLISGDINALISFAEQHQTIVVKPVNAMGGRGVYKFTSGDSNLPVALEGMLASEHTVMAQVWLPDIEQGGDKRVLVIGGQPYQVGLARTPHRGDHRGNLAANAMAEPFQLGETELKIARDVGHWLYDRGIPFAGLDIIGDRLTEINITSPTCVRELEKCGYTDISDRVVESLLTFAERQAPIG